MDTFCRNFQGILLNKQDDHRWLLFRGRCKMWNCEYCAIKNKMMWKAHLLRAIAHIGGAWSMVTITASAWANDKRRTLETIMRNFDKLMKRLKRAWGRFEYVRIYEKHKSGQFHIHLLVSWHPVDALLPSAYQTIGAKRRYRGVAYKALKTNSAECGLGWACDISPILQKADGSVGVIACVGYVVKYMSKDVGADMPKYTRRIQCSIGVGSANPRSKSAGWELRAGIPVSELDSREIVDLTIRKILTESDFEHGSYPPVLCNQVIRNQEL